MVHRVTCCRKVRRPKDQVLHLSAGPSLKAPVAFTVRHKGVRASRTREPEGRDIMGMWTFSPPKRGGSRELQSTRNHGKKFRIQQHTVTFPPLLLTWQTLKTIGVLFNWWGKTAKCALSDKHKHNLIPNATWLKMCLLAKRKCYKNKAVSSAFVCGRWANSVFHTLSLCQKQSDEH